MKTAKEFRESLHQNQPPEGITKLLQAMWWDAKGDWNKAHTMAQDIGTAEAAWVHAYLHRKEGDEGNAGYWYSHAGKPHSTQSHDQEWSEIVQSFLVKD